jgi:mono/diheme cytochrome c family protein
VLIGLSAVGWAAETVDQATRYFEEHVRPVLATRCFECHGEQKQSSDLRVDSLAGLLAGGASGPAIAPGKPNESLLVEAIRHESLEMPPTGKLPDEQIAAITRWIEMGAPWPEHDASVRKPAAPATKITDDDRAYWAFQPVRDPQPPAVADDGWCRNDLDRFISRKLTEEGLRPAPEASPAALVRRLYFDLLGLPPSPQEIDAFLADTAPDAYERLVDRLLDSPRHAERWARHWLDLVRYAESDGFRQDAYRPHAWRYRDYVIRSFNEDKPYDQFVAEQLAGDELAPHDPDALAATSYLRHWTYEYNQRDVRTQWDNILNDITDVTGEVFLGLGVGCARCHDHKYDPILKADYYRLKAFFAPLWPRDDLPYATADQGQEYRTRLAAWEEKTAEVRRQIDDLERPLIDAARQRAADKFPPDIRPMLLKAPAERTPLEHQLAELANRQAKEEVQKISFGSQLKGDAKTRWETLQRELAQFGALKPKPLPPAFTVTDVGPHAPPTTIPGDRQQREVEPGFLSVLDPGPAAVVPPPSGSSTGRRTALARWLTQPDNPLVPRVMVNRIWQQHFGVGLVSTPSDFGRLGDPPSHPELLDWLARRFVQSGWRLKPLHRLMVTSATYRQAAVVDLAQADKDPDNRWLGRMTVRRLDAEQIRDALLAASGELDLAVGGPSVDNQRPRRSIYTRVIRNARDPLIEAFDGADGFSSTDRRNVTTTPTQALLMSNGLWPLERAQAFAERLRKTPGVPLGGDRELVTWAYRWAYGRGPDTGEADAAVRFLERQSTVDGAEHQDKSRALVDFCHVLLNSNEFLYVD